MSHKNPLQELLEVSGNISIENGIATMPSGETIDFREHLVRRVLVTVSGGVSEAHADTGVEMFIFDWDDFADDPKNAKVIPKRFAHLVAENSNAPIANTDYDLPSNPRKPRMTP